MATFCPAPAPITRIFCIFVHQTSLPLTFPRLLFLSFLFQFFVSFLDIRNFKGRKMCHCRWKSWEFFSRTATAPPAKFIRPFFYDLRPGNDPLVPAYPTFHPYPLRSLPYIPLHCPAVRHIPSAASSPHEMSAENSTE